MWIGFGQTLAKNLGTYSDPLPPTTVEGCPAGWIDNTTTFFIPANASLIYEDNEWAPDIACTDWIINYVSIIFQQLLVHASLHIWAVIYVVPCGFLLALHYHWRLLQLPLQAPKSEDSKSPADKSRLLQHSGPLPQTHPGDGQKLGRWSWLCEKFILSFITLQLFIFTSFFFFRLSQAKNKTWDPGKSWATVSLMSISRGQLMKPMST